MDWIDITSRITNILNAGTERFNAQEFQAVILAGMKQTAPEFYTVVKYGAPFKSTEEYDEHVKKVQTKYSVMDPYFLEEPYDKPKGQVRVRF